MAGKRNVPPHRMMRRRAPSRKPKTKIVVVCEGEKTEPQYLRDFIRDHGINLVEIEIVPAAGVPVSIVDKAVSRKKDILRQAKRFRDSFDKNFRIWGVFDCDDHPNIADAKIRARDNDISLAISNPCFELWALIHFGDHDAPVERHQIQGMLSEVMPGYHPKRAKTFEYELMRGQYADAELRAQRMCARRQEEDDDGGNPSTNVYELTRLLLRNGKQG